MPNQYGIFQSIVEGDQADAYRRRKYDEKKEKERRENSWRDHRGSERRYDVGNTVEDGYKPGLTPEARKRRSEQRTSDLHRWRDANHMAYNAAINSGKNALTDDDFDGFVDRARDGANRHLRRHPQKESGLCDFV